MRRFGWAALCAAGVLAFAGHAGAEVRSIEIEAGPRYADYLARTITFTRTGLDTVAIFGSFNAEIALDQQNSWSPAPSSYSEYHATFQFSALATLGQLSEWSGDGPWGTAQLNWDYRRIEASLDTFRIDVTPTGPGTAFYVNGSSEGAFSQMDYTCIGPLAQCEASQQYYSDDKRGQFGDAPALGAYSDSFGFAAHFPGDTVTRQGYVLFTEIDDGLWTDTPAVGQFYSGTLGIFGYRAVYATVPEPSAWAMLILGFFGIGAALRHQRGYAISPP